jgi:short-subunit dehydrogenase
MVSASIRSRNAGAELQVGMQHALKLLELWHRRYWRPNAEALAAYQGLKPVTVVTGASHGIGLALARRFAAAGHHVMLVARTSDALALAAGDIEQQFRVTAIPVVANLLRGDGITAIEDALAHNHAYVDVLVNNAGLGLSGAFHAQQTEDILRLIDLNIRALTELTHRYLHGMRVRGAGGILNVASLGGYSPGPYQAVYYASKAYVISLTEALAAEVVGEGVRVAVLAPGPVATDFHKRMGADQSIYVHLLPLIGPQAVATSGYRGFLWRRRVIVPGLHNEAIALAMRIMPHRILIPIIGWLLRPRRGDV